MRIQNYLAVLSLLVACGSDHASSTPDSGSGSAQPDAPPDTPEGPPAVTFSYTPSWGGVTEVDVIGGFGQSNDWTAPLVTLTQSGNTWTGSYQLPAGQYLYLFHVVGDADAGNKAATYDRYVVDPAQAGYMLCPMQSPTYGNDPNPCSQLTVPVGATPTMINVTGTVLVSGAPAAGYLVVLERDEMGSHHYFVNRTTTAADGTYALQAVTGTYRVQIQHPQYESKNDSQLNPSKLGIARRDISDAFALTADVALSNVDMAFDYSAFAPTTGTPTLPTAFTFGSGVKTTLEVYGTGNEIGDPWYNGTAVTTGTASFDGNFNTSKAMTPAVVIGTQYFWGTETATMGLQGADSLKFTLQSLVYPITWGLGTGG